MSEALTSEQDLVLPEQRLPTLFVLRATHVNAQNHTDELRHVDVITTTRDERASHVFF